LTYAIHIDAAACAAHGDCADLVPEVFSVDDVAVVVGTAPDELVLEAARVCPSTAIVLSDAATGERVYP
jgi:ferredoxin